MAFDSHHLTAVLAGVTGLYETLAWGLNLGPWTSHPADLTVGQRIGAVSANALPHFLLGTLGFSRKQPTLMAVYTSYISFFTSMQTYFWWMPYLFNFISSVRKEHFAPRLATTKKILPAIRDHQVPSLEHTLLFPLSVATLVSAAYTYIHSPYVTQVAKKTNRFVEIFSLCMGGLTLVLSLVRKDNSWVDKVALAVAVLDSFGVSLGVVYLNSKANKLDKFP